MPPRPPHLEINLMAWMDEQTPTLFLIA